MTLPTRLTEAATTYANSDIGPAAALLREAATALSDLERVHRAECDALDKVTQERDALRAALDKVRYLADKIIGYALTQEDADALLGLSFFLSASEKEQIV